MEHMTCPVHFRLSIYKKINKTRKNHNLVLMPDLAAVEKFNAKLDNIGNIKSSHLATMRIAIRATGMRISHVVPYGLRI